MTQSGGRAAGIQLQVGLDLAFFRAQLPKLGATANGYPLTFKVKFDRRSIQNELNALGANIKKRNYFLEVKTNLAAEIKNARDLAVALDNLARSSSAAKTSVGQRLGVGAIGRVPSKGGLESRDVAKLYKASAQAGLLAFDKEVARSKVSMVAAMEAIGIDAITGLLNGLSSQNARLRAAAESLGEALIKTTKTSLGIASPSKKFEEIGKNVGEGFEKGALSSMDNAFDAMERKMRQRGKILDTIARGIFGMLGMDPAAMMQQARQQKAVPPRTPIAGLLPEYTSRGAREEIMRQLGAGGGGGGGPSDQGPGKLALSNEALGKRVSAILEEYFRVAEVQVRETFDPRELKRSLNIFAYVAQALRDAEARTRQARVEQKVDAFIKALELTMQTAEARLRIQAAQVRTVAAQQPLLPAGRVAGLLPGRPSQASVLELNNILAGAIREYFNAVAREIKPSATTQGRPLLGPGSTVAGLLPPAGGTTPRGAMRFNAVSTGAFLGQPQFMRAPNVPSPMAGGGGGGNVPPRPPLGGGGGMGGFGRALGGINLPGAGLVREIGDEFAMATKQVLLFGTAYKALAFLTSFPAQVGQAVGALQSFNNTLKAISPTADEARASNQFILDIVDRYNVPLQSARDGFTKLYASMAPAGFKGDEIRALFTGVSQAAATFGMSADKVDRVNYAFAQMASKGQVMSEELKGQLGDVLPGAMGIFAEAAGFTGPDAIQKFSKALEDGAYKGEAMRGLLKNVTVVLTKEFGPGAEGAARTFQGVINRMQNSTKLLYEAFEPVAVGFLNSVVVPLTSGIKTITDGFNAFFTGQAAQTAGGSVLAKQLETLRPAFEGIAANIKQILPLLQSFASTALSLGQVLLQIAGNPFVGYLARIYLSVLPLTMVLRVLNLQALIPLIGSFLRAIPAFISFNAAMMSGVGANRALTVTMQLTGQTAGITAGKIRLVSAAVATLGSAAILAGIGLLVERFLMMKGAIDGVRQSTQQMLGSISGMANSGAVRELKNVGKDLQKQRGTFEELRSFVSGGAIAGGEKRLTEAGAKKFEEVGMGSFVKKDVFGKPYIADFLRASEIIEEKLKGLDKQSSKVQEKLPLAAKIAANLARQAQSAQAIAPIPGGDGAGKPPKEQSLESYYSLQDQLAKNFTQDQLQRMEQEYQARVDRINSEFDLREARANSFQKEAIRFERQMSDIELKRQKALLDASAEVIRAQGSVTGGAGANLTGGGGFSTAQLQKASSEASKFTGIANMCSESVKAFYKSLGISLPGVTAWADTVRKAGKTMTDWSKLQAGDIVATGRPGDTPHVGVYTGGNNVFHQSRKRGLKAGNYPDLDYFKSGYFVRPNAMDAGAPRKVTGDEKRDVIADQKTQLALAQQSLTVQLAEAQAIRDAAVAWAQYTASIAPVEEQALQNDILAKKNELVRASMPDDIIEKEMKYFEAQQKTTLARAANDKLLKDGLIDEKQHAKNLSELQTRLAGYNTELDRNIQLQRQQSFDASMGALRKQMELAGIIDPRAELRARIRQEKPGYTSEQVEEEAAAQERIAQLEASRDRIRGIASSIGDAFGTAFKGIITGSATVQEALAGMFQSIADSFADMVAKMIAEWLKTQILQGFQSIFGAFTGGFGGGAGLNAASALGTNPNVAAYAPLGFANGGIAAGGFTAFANGGIVTGPTMGLVGEGRYNEAIVPLPDGKSIPVELGGMGGMGGEVTSNIVVNINNGQMQGNGNSNGSELGRKIEGAVKQVLVSELRPGGILSTGRR